jgi:hypothetical protein
VVITDESGYDYAKVEEAVSLARRHNARVFIIGMEARFGVPRAFRVVKHEQNELLCALDRGPESIVTGLIDLDCFSLNLPSLPSGLAPFSQMRLAQQSQGLFIAVPFRCGKSTGFTSLDNFDSMAMSAYIPKYELSKTAEQRISQSPFRTAIHSVINQATQKLFFTIRRTHPARTDLFKKAVDETTRKVALGIAQIQSLKSQLNSVRKQRANEKAPRWRAQFDLTYAILHLYEFRLWQIALSMQERAHEIKAQPQEPRPAKSAPFLLPNMTSSVAFRLSTKPAFFDQSLDDTLVVLKSLDSKIKRPNLRTLHKRTLFLLKLVIELHNETPWATLAEFELKRGFGISLDELQREPIPPLRLKKPPPRF